MGLRIRKSYNLGGGFRINVSGQRRRLLVGR